MLLVAVDIGNTNVVIGFLDDGHIAGTYRITTKANHTSDEYGLMITQFLRLSGYTPGDVDDVIITSVVPKVMHSFRASIVKFLNIDPMIVGPGVKTGINIRMDNPQNMGADCIADCAGAYYEYGGPILVADFGTATTFNYVTADASVICGLITTGIRTGAAALWDATAQLPEVEITRPRRFWQKHQTSHASRLVLQLPRRHRTYDHAIPSRNRRGFPRGCDGRIKPRVRRRYRHDRHLRP